MLKSYPLLKKLRGRVLLFMVDNFLKEIPKKDYGIYREKSKQAFEAMQIAFNNKLWAPSTREAVFTCINAVDALLAKFSGYRNMSKNHMDIVYIIENSKYIPIESAKKQSSRLRKIISQKNLADYENKAVTLKKASEIKLQAERFYAWAMEYL